MMNKGETQTLSEAVRNEREASFFRLRGGYPIPLAGATWWAFLAALGYRLHSHHLWIFIAFCTSGLIFPLAILYGRIFRINFTGDRTPVSSAIFPALGAMMLFWPVAATAYWTQPDLVPLILAVGMSAAWPVVGWLYNRTALFSTHAVVRAVVCFVLWNWFPSTRFTLLPLAVALIYLLTVVVIFFASNANRSVKFSSGDSQTPALAPSL